MLQSVASARTLTCGGPQTDTLCGTAQVARWATCELFAIAFCCQTRSNRVAMAATLVRHRGRENTEPCAYWQKSELLPASARKPHNVALNRARWVEIQLEGMEGCDSEAHRARTKPGLHQSGARETWRFVVVDVAVDVP